MRDRCTQAHVRQKVLTQVVSAVSEIHRERRRAELDDAVAFDPARSYPAVSLERAQPHGREYRPSAALVPAAAAETAEEQAEDDEHDSQDRPVDDQKDDAQDDEEGSDGHG